MRYRNCIALRRCLPVINTIDNNNHDTNDVDVLQTMLRQYTSWHADRNHHLGGRDLSSLPVRDVQDGGHGHGVVVTRWRKLPKV